MNFRYICVTIIVLILSFSLCVISSNDDIACFKKVFVLCWVWIPVLMTVLMLHVPGRDWCVLNVNSHPYVTVLLCHTVMSCFRKCSLSQMGGVCRYKVKLGDDNSWNCISLHARNRVSRWTRVICSNTQQHRIPYIIRFMHKSIACHNLYYLLILVINYNKNITTR